MIDIDNYDRALLTVIPKPLAFSLFNSELRKFC